MARTVAELPKGAHITGYASLGVISKMFALGKAREILAETGRHIDAAVALVRESLSRQPIKLTTE